MSPRAQPEPYLQRTSPEAAPKRISGRTSYLLVRLAFHPYPQVIQSLCNVKRFAPPRGLTLASRCPWVAHQVSGLRPATPNALFRLAFAPAPRLPSLNLATKRNSSAHSSIGTPSPGRSQAPTAWRVVSPASHGSPRVPWYSGSRPGPDGFRLRGSHPLWRTVPGPSAIHAVLRSAGPATPPPLGDGLGFSPFARRY